MIITLLTAVIRLINRTSFDLHFNAYRPDRIKVIVRLSFIRSNELCFLGHAGIRIEFSLFIVIPKEVNCRRDFCLFNMLLGPSNKRVPFVRERISRIYLDAGVIWNIVSSNNRSVSQCILIRVLIRSVVCVPCYMSISFMFSINILGTKFNSISKAWFFLCTVWIFSYLSITLKNLERISRQNRLISVLKCRAIPFLNHPVREYLGFLSLTRSRSSACRDCNSIAQILVKVMVLLRSSSGSSIQVIFHINSFCAKQLGAPLSVKVKTACDPRAYAVSICILLSWFDIPVNIRFGRTGLIICICDRIIIQCIRIEVEFIAESTIIPVPSYKFIVIANCSKVSDIFIVINTE